MNRSLITLIFLLTLSFSLNAQTVRIGPKIGLNVAKYTGDVNVEARSLAGLQAGGIVEIEIMDWFSVQPEVLYSVKGLTIGDVKRVDSYVDLPIMAKFYPIDGLYGEFGPQIGFLIAANAKNATQKVSTSQDYKTVDMGLGFGAGYVIRDLGLGFGLRYSAGLTNIFKDNSRIKNGVFQISASWAFEL